MSDHKDRPQELSSARGNFAVVRIDLVTGQSRVLNDADSAQEAAEATRRAALKNDDVPVFASSAS
ncbi:MAG: hypothetical protein QOI48_476 [Solirubrobacteraceae bacterium]|jgi:hypothetical protein|nr:hypothetical protein [Solirubrobacteraceae bacterium]